MSKDIWIVSENNENEITDLTKELLGIGKSLKKESDGLVCVILFGMGENILTDQLTEYGADRIYWVKDKGLSDYNSEKYLNNLEHLVKKENPRLLLLGMTYNGRELGAQLSARLKTYFIPGCISATVIDENHIEAVRWFCNGEAQLQTVVESDATVVLGIPPDTRGIDQQRFSGKSKIINVSSVQKDESRIKHLNYTASDFHEIDLTEADIVISGGNGIGDRQTYDQLWELGELMESPVGGSRLAQDKGWITDDRMVGASGKIIRARLYLAFGISGAIQHVMGIKDCKNVVAINTEPNAEIMKMADLAVIADVHDVLPALIQKFRERKELQKKTGLNSNEKP